MGEYNFLAEYRLLKSSLKEDYQGDFDKLMKCSIVLGRTTQKILDEDKHLQGNLTPSGIEFFKEVYPEIFKEDETESERSLEIIASLKIKDPNE